MKKPPASIRPDKKMMAAETTDASIPFALAEEVLAKDRGARFCIAGIGASAGGLEAICELFEAMPADSNIAFVVVQHLSPTQKSLAAEIIGKHAAIGTRPGADGMLLEPGNIYTIPPNSYPSLCDGRLRLDKPTNKNGPRLPIDHFFKSLANDQRERAIGIILSGSGTDGSLGIKRIVANGGIVLAQSPQTAQFDSMPRSAIGSGLVHCVLPVAEMPAALTRYARHDYALQPAADGEGAERGGLDDIVRIIQQRAGHNFSGYRSSTLLRRVRRRMGLRAIDTLADYAVLLNAESLEIDALLKDLLIGVSEFFHDPEAWRELKASAIAPLVNVKKPGEAIRIWVPGCATGEEAYTIAIVVLEQLREARKRCPLVVFATDTNEHALQQGRLGNYPSGISTQVSAEHLRRYFVESTGDHHYQVNKSLREVVVFGHQNLMSAPAFSRVDLICCRNLMLYLESAVQTKVVSLLRFALLPGAYLFLGSAETLGQPVEALTPISRKWRIFQHSGGHVSAAAEADAGNEQKPLVRQLENELQATRDDLKKTIERLQYSNDELREFNEELASSKEELRALNDELTMVNRQLQLKVADLENRNADIANLLSSSQIATICLDRKFRIKWFSPNTKPIGNIIAGDIGRPITDFSAAGLGDHLVEDARSVLATMESKQRELVAPDGHWYLRRVVPYRSDNEHVGGVVLTYADISEAKHTAQVAAEALRAMATSLEDRVRERTVQLRTLTAELALTEERERRVLARDLHDDLGQVLAIVKIKLTSLAEDERRGALQTPLKDIESLVDQANRSVRSLMLQLHPPALQTLGLVAALEWLSDEMERLYGLSVRIDKDAKLPALEEPARTTIFRAVRELLINVAKHARTNTAQINCHRVDAARIAISVTDQGLGFDYQRALSNPAKDSGFGLMSVRERIEFIGGEMNVDSTPGYGTTITIVFPARHEH